MLLEKHKGKKKRGTKSELKWKMGGGTDLRDARAHQAIVEEFCGRDLTVSRTIQRITRHRLGKGGKQRVDALEGRVERSISRCLMRTGGGNFEVRRHA